MYFFTTLLFCICNNYSLTVHYLDITECASCRKRGFVRCCIIQCKVGTFNFLPVNFRKGLGSKNNGKKGWQKKDNYKLSSLTTSPAQATCLILLRYTFLPPPQSCCKKMPGWVYRCLQNLKTYFARHDL